MRGLAFQELGKVGGRGTPGSDLLGNPAAIERAIQTAAPDCDKALKVRERLEGELAKVEKARNRVLDWIARDLITDVQAEAKLVARRPGVATWARQRSLRLLDGHSARPRSRLRNAPLRGE